jgi:hypothetical protein
MADSAADKARKAREARNKERYPRAKDIEYKGKIYDYKMVNASEGTKKIVREMANGKPSVAKKVEEFFNGPKKLTAKQEREAAAMQTRRYVDKSKTSMRANIIASRAKKKKAEAVKAKAKKTK